MAAILADDNFKNIFLNGDDRIPIRISLKFIPKSPIDNKPAFTGSGNGLAPNKRQAITWTNADPIHRRMYAALGGNELKSLAPLWYGSNFKSVIFEYTLRIKFTSIQCEISIRWRPQNAFEDKSTLVRVMAFPLPDPLLTQVYVTARRHQAAMS